MYYNKKGGWQFEVVVVLVLALAIGGVLFFGTNKYTNALETSGDLEVCRLGIASVAKAKEVPVIGGELRNGLNVKCPIKKLSYEKIKLGDQDKINEGITNSINDCIYVSWEGKLDWTESAWLGLPGDYACVVCSMIKFGEGSKEFYEGNSLYNWIKNNKVPPNYNMTYEEKFKHFNEGYVFKPSVIPGQTVIKSIGINLNNNKPLDSGETYFVYFSHTTNSLFMKIAGGLATIQYGSLAGFDAQGSTISLKSIKDVKEECSTILNIKEINIEGKSEEEIKKSLGIT